MDHVNNLFIFKMKSGNQVAFKVVWNIVILLHLKKKSG